MEKRSGRREERRGEIKGSAAAERKEGRDADKKICYRSLCLHPSLPHSPTHSSKYNDHRKVISKLSQSEDSEPTESHKKKARRETEGTAGYQSPPVVYAYREEQLVMRERG